MSGGEDETKPFLGRYQLQKKIAVGGMAELYLAQVSGAGGFQKQVVVKRILPQLAESEELFRMFLDEARIAATLDHPNVIQVYDSCEENGEYFMAMEYLDGTDLRTLRKVLADRELAIPWEHAIYVISNIAAGLHYAHEKCDFDGEPLGIVHRDVTPHNIFLTRDGTVKLVDFGIAKAQGRMTETALGTLKGKLAYMSPEQCRGEDIDRRSDIYSLGIILYEITTGRRLYKSTTEYELINEIVDGTIPPPSTLMEYPKLLEKIVLRCLCKSPEDRYPTAQSLQADLEAFAQEHRLMLSTLSFASFIKPLLEEAAAVAEERWKHRQDVSPLGLSSKGAQGSSGQFRKPQAPGRSPSVLAESTHSEEDAIPSPVEPRSELSDLLKNDEFHNDELTARVPTDMLAKLRDEERETAEKERQEQSKGVVRAVSTAQNISVNVVQRDSQSFDSVEVEPEIDGEILSSEMFEEVAKSDPADIRALKLAKATRAASATPLGKARTLSAIPEEIQGGRSGTVLVAPLEAHPSTEDFHITKPGSKLWLVGVVAVGAAALVFVLSTGSKKEEPSSQTVAPAAVDHSPRILRVTSSSKAEVWLLLGRTPVQYQRAAGEIGSPRLRVEYDGYDTEEVTLGADAWSRDADGQTYIDATLNLHATGTDAPELDAGVPTETTDIAAKSIVASSGDSPGILRVQSDPPAAKTWLFLGTTDPELTLRNIASGTDVHLRLEVSGAPPVFRSVLSSEFDASGKASVSISIAKPKEDGAGSSTRSGRKRSRSERNNSTSPDDVENPEKKEASDKGSPGAPGKSRRARKPKARTLPSPTPNWAR
ncbi:MAG: serine/threonine protein kinase [Kofleriaceae bacterium]|nr:serine/threonine protein kinase [Kofleriaceae bacterium]